MDVFFLTIIGIIIFKIRNNSVKIKKYGEQDKMILKNRVICSS